MYSRPQAADMAVMEKKIMDVRCEPVNNVTIDDHIHPSIT